MIETSRIKLDAHEIVDVVEEQLSWLAIASTQEGHSYVCDDFRRAEATISLGKNSYGLLDVDGVEAFDASAWMGQTQDDRVAQNIVAWRKGKDVALRAMPILGERMRFAEVVQCDPLEPTEAWCGAAKGLRPSDYAEEDGVGRAYTSLVGVCYKLRSIGVCTKSDSDRILRGTATRGLRAVVVQEVVAFADGRSASDSIPLALHPDGGLRYSSGRRIDEAKELLEIGAPMHPWSQWFHEYILHQFQRRPFWTVELALSKDRTGVGLTTDAEGARAIVKALGRDQTRSGRRASLVHWVKEHYRRQRGSAELSVVRGHLRGAVSCEAGGMWATIYPSRIDVEAASNRARFEVAP